MADDQQRLIKIIYANFAMALIAFFDLMGLINATTSHKNGTSKSILASLLKYKPYEWYTTGIL
jgi:hypothetical protein